MDENSRSERRTSQTVDVNSRSERRTSQTVDVNSRSERRIAHKKNKKNSGGPNMGRNSASERALMYKLEKTDHTVRMDQTGRTKTVKKKGSYWKKNDPYGPPYEQVGGG